MAQPTRALALRGVGALVINVLSPDQKCPTCDKVPSSVSKFYGAAPRASGSSAWS